MFKQGKWYASITVECTPSRIQTDKGAIGLDKTGLNRSLLDVGISNLKSLIKYKVTEAGGFYIEVPTKKLKPSQTCPNCGHQKKKELSERIHSCQCGYTCDRDVAAAIVMLNYARGLGTSLLQDVESPSSTSCGSMRQLGALRCDSSCEA